MRSLRNVLLAAAAVSMTASPVLAAAANPAAKLSIAPNARVGAPAGKSKLAGGGFFIAAIAVVAVIAGVIIIADDDDDDSN